MELDLDFTSTVSASAPLSWFWEEPSVPTGGRQVNTNPSHGPPSITPTPKWCKTVIGGPPSRHRVQMVSRQRVGQSEQMKPWNCCRYRHFFFSAEDNRMRKVPTVQTKVGDDAHTSVQLESHHLMEHSSLGPTSHGSYSFFFFSFKDTLGKMWVGFSLRS